MISRQLLWGSMTGSGPRRHAKSLGRTTQYLPGNSRLYSKKTALRRLKAAPRTSYSTAERPVSAQPKDAMAVARFNLNSSHPRSELQRERSRLAHIGSQSSTSFSPTTPRKTVTCLSSWVFRVKHSRPWSCCHQRCCAAPATGCRSGVLAPEVWTSAGVNSSVTVLAEHGVLAPLSPWEPDRSQARGCCSARPGS